MWVCNYKYLLNYFQWFYSKQNSSSPFNSTFKYLHSKTKKEQLNTVAGSRQWNCSVWKEVLSWLRIEGYLKKYNSNTIGPRFFSLRRIKTHWERWTKWKDKKWIHLWPFLVFLFWALKCGIISYALVGTIALRVLKILRIKNPNPKKGFIGATVALFCFKPFFRSTDEKVTQLICHIIGRGLLSLYPRLE